MERFATDYVLSYGRDVRPSAEQLWAYDIRRRCITLLSVPIFLVIETTTQAFGPPGTTYVMGHGTKAYLLAECNLGYAKSLLREMAAADFVPGYHTEAPFVKKMAEYVETIQDEQRWKLFLIALIGAIESSPRLSVSVFNLFNPVSAHLSSFAVFIKRYLSPGMAFVSTKSWTKMIPLTREQFDAFPTRVATGYEKMPLIDRVGRLSEIAYAFSPRPDASALSMQLDASMLAWICGISTASIHHEHRIAFKLGPHVGWKYTDRRIYMDALSMFFQMARDVNTVLKVITDYLIMPNDVSVSKVIVPNDAQWWWIAKALMGAQSARVEGAEKQFLLKKLGMEDMQELDITLTRQSDRVVIVAGTQNEFPTWQIKEVEVYGFGNGVKKCNVLCLWDMPMFEATVKKSTMNGTIDRLPYVVYARPEQPYVVLDTIPIISTKKQLIINSLKTVHKQIREILVTVKSVELFSFPARVADAIFGCKLTKDDVRPEMQRRAENTIRLMAPQFSVFTAYHAALQLARTVVSDTMGYVNSYGNKSTNTTDPYELRAAMALFGEPSVSDNSFEVNATTPERFGQLGPLTYWFAPLYSNPGISKFEDAIRAELDLRPFAKRSHMYRMAVTLDSPVYLPGAKTTEQYISETGPASLRTIRLDRSVAMDWKFK